MRPREFISAPIARESLWLSPFQRAASQHAMPLPKQAANRTASVIIQSEKELTSPIRVLSPE